MCRHMSKKSPQGEERRANPVTTKPIRTLLKNKLSAECLSAPSQKCNTIINLLHLDNGGQLLSCMATKVQF